MILFISNNNLGYARFDRETLACDHEVKSFVYHPERGWWPALLAQWQLLLFLYRYRRQAKMVVVWFADWHAVLPLWAARWWGIKSLLFLGGYDVGGLAYINYGLTGIRRQAAEWAVKRATVCLVPSQQLLMEARQRFPQAMLRLVPLGVETTPGQVQRDPRLVITIAAADRPNRWYVKGLDRFCALVPLLPEYKLVTIGISGPLKRRLPTGLTNIERATPAEIDQWRKKASVYVQLSRRESFCLAAAEALADGCAVVAARSGSLPEVLGNHAIYVAGGDPQENAAAVILATQMDAAARELAQKDILELYHPDRRRRLLRTLVEELCRS